MMQVSVTDAKTDGICWRYVVLLSIKILVVIGGFFKLKESNNDLASAGLTLTLMLLAFVGLFKVWSVLLSLNKVRFITKAIGELMPKSTDHRFYKKYYSFSYKVIKFLDIGTFCLQILCLFAPFFSEQKLPILMSYPCYPNTTLGYIVAFVAQWFMIHATLASAVTIHCFFCWQINNVCFLLETMRDHLEHLSRRIKPDSLFWLDINEALVLKDKLRFTVRHHTFMLIELIKLHQKVIIGVWHRRTQCQVAASPTRIRINCKEQQSDPTPRYLDPATTSRSGSNTVAPFIIISSDLEVVYGPLVLITFLVSSIIICSNVFLIMTLSVGESSVFIIGLIMMIGVIGMMSWFGEMLKTMSWCLCEAAFFSGWEDQGQSHKILILFFIMRSQRPCHLTLMRFAELSMATFASVMTKSVSYFALVSSMYEAGK